MYSLVEVHQTLRFAKRDYLWLLIRLSAPGAAIGRA